MRLSSSLLSRSSRRVQAPYLFVLTLDCVKCAQQADEQNDCGGCHDQSLMNCFSHSERRTQVYMGEECRRALKLRHTRGSCGKPGQVKNILFMRQSLRKKPNKRLRFSILSLSLVSFSVKMYNLPFPWQTNCPTTRKYRVKNECKE